ncbi:MAG: V-type ATPase subunit [Clostridia bacterium]|nr:V-type ATPase subunit [Clostridia bacterium]
MAGNKGYLYTNGVISAISSKLLKKETFNKIIESTDLDNSISLLNNTTFVNGKKINSIFDLNNLLKIEEFKINEFLKKECPISEFVDYIDCINDYNNLNLFYKSILFKFNINEKNIIEGKCSILKIKECLTLNNFDGLNSKYIKELFEKISKIKNKQKDWVKIDYYFKSQCYKNLFNIVKNNKILLEILRNKIDFQNISLCLRVNNFDEFNNQFIENGILTLNFFENYFKSGKISVISKSNKVLDNLLKILKLNDKEKFDVLNKECNLIELKTLHNFNDNIESPIPFLKYYYRKILEIKNLRMIFSLKSNNLNSKIKDRFLEEN